MKKWICIGLFLIGTCSVQAQDLVSDFLAKTKENKVFTQVNISSRMFQMISEITDAETESIIRKEEFMLMSFCGVIDLKKISRLAKAVNVEGMEYLGKVKK